MNLGCIHWHFAAEIEAGGGGGGGLGGGGEGGGSSLRQQ